MQILGSLWHAKSDEEQFDPETPLIESKNCNNHCKSLYLKHKLLLHSVNKIFIRIMKVTSLKKLTNWFKRRHKLFSIFFIETAKLFTKTQLTKLFNKRKDNTTLTHALYNWLLQIFIWSCTLFGHTNYFLTSWIKLSWL